MKKLNIRASLKEIQIMKSNKSTDSWMASNTSKKGGPYSHVSRYEEKCDTVYKESCSTEYKLECTTGK